MTNGVKLKCIFNEARREGEKRKENEKTKEREIHNGIRTSNLMSEIIT